MAITEDDRHELYEGLIELLGRERATTLMEHLPPVGWADVATKRDLDQQSALLRGEADRLRHDMETRFANLRGETQTGFAGVRHDMQTEFASVRHEMQTGTASLRVELANVEVRFERALREQSRTFFLGMLAANATLAGLAFAAAQLA